MPASPGIAFCLVCVFRSALVYFVTRLKFFPKESEAHKLFFGGVRVEEEREKKNLSSAGWHG